MKFIYSQHFEILEDVQEHTEEGEFIPEKLQLEEENLQVCGFLS